MSQNLQADSHEPLLEQLLTEEDDTVFLVDPSVDLLDAVATIGRTHPDDTPTLKILARESVLKPVRSDFLLASRLADLVESGTADIRVAPDPLHNTLVASDSTVSAVVGVNGRLAGLRSDDEAFAADVLAHYTDQFERGEDFPLRTPGRTRLLDTLETEFDTAMREDFQTVLDSAEAVTGDAGHLDAVQISILLAARHEQLLYDISGWGEDTGVASKTTFSRAKTNLEDAGLITTEKVPKQVGRPRMRLLLADEELTTVDPAGLATAAVRILDR